MEFKTGKFYKTRDGRKAQIFMLDNGDEYMIGAVQQADKTWAVRTWPICGRFIGDLCDNIVSEWREPIERKTTAWVKIGNPIENCATPEGRLGIFDSWVHKTDLCHTKVEITVREVQE